ncbi:MAG: dephospho-CoA kinase [Muribaculaceae bacterium]|nr:dephospho-CoA kinase [Muribaculaceae bacterium]
MQIETIAITGGIGSGKSVVCRMLAYMGHEVYDCDSRAKAIMDHSREIKESISARISPDCITPEGDIDRKMLSSIVFADSAMLETLNAIVHQAVREDICRHREALGQAGVEKVFVETAILYQSGLDMMVDEVWEVTAPIPLRIERVCRRNSVTPAEASARIEAQEAYRPDRSHNRIRYIANDGIHPLLPRINSLLSK